MKNFQQAPKQRRVDVQKAKHKLATSKPIKQFTHYTEYNWRGNWRAIKTIFHVDKRL